MHHRRAASDTAMFKRLAPAESKKEGSSSSQGSRSATPLVSMLKPAGKYSDSVIVKFCISRWCGTKGCLNFINAASSNMLFISYCYYYILPNSKLPIQK